MKGFSVRLVSMTILEASALSSSLSVNPLMKSAVVSARGTDLKAALLRAQFWLGGHPHPITVLGRFQPVSRRINIARKGFLVFVQVSGRCPQFVAHWRQWCLGQLQ